MNISYFTPYDIMHSDASSIRARYFVSELRRRNHNVNLLKPTLNAPSNKLGLISRLIRELLLGIEVSFRLLINKNDLVVLSSPPYITVLIAGLTLGLVRKRYILDIRDIYPEVFIHLGLINENGFIAKILKHLTKHLYRKANAIITATQGLNTIVDSYGLNVPSKTILNGYDPDLFYKSEEKFQNFTLVFHGNLAKMQNIDLLLDIAERLPSEIDIVVAGDGPQAQKLKAHQRIKFLGKIPYQEVAAVVRKSHLGLSFRNNGIINETAFPVKTFEYIGAGIPIISTPPSEAGSFIEERGLGKQFQNDQVDEIVNSILEYRNYQSPLTDTSELTRQSQAQRFADFVLKP